VAVGLCEPREAAQFCRTRAPSVTCLCDRTKAAYSAFGLFQGSLYQVMVGPEVSLAYARAGMQGHVPGASRSRSDDWRMMPGTFAIDTNGTIRAVHYARHAGDQPDLGAMLRALD
jgi:hypothetical protein